MELIKWTSEMSNLLSSPPGSLLIELQKPNAVKISDCNFHHFWNFSTMNDNLEQFSWKWSLAQIDFFIASVVLLVLYLLWVCVAAEMSAGSAECRVAAQGHLFTSIQASSGLLKAADALKVGWWDKPLHANVFKWFTVYLIDYFVWHICHGGAKNTSREFFFLIPLFGSASVWLDEVLIYMSWICSRLWMEWSYLFLTNAVDDSVQKHLFFPQHFRPGTSSSSVLEIIVMDKYDSWLQRCF